MPPAAGSSRDDLVLEPAAARTLLNEPVVVEEKLDGANVMLWRADDGLQAATRAGGGAIDRAGQLGPLRRWAGDRVASLMPVVERGWVIYAEWLWLSHSIAYSSLPQALVAIDLLSASGGFAAVDERDRVCAEAGLLTPPSQFRGMLHTRGQLDRLFAKSAFGNEAAEGLIVRPDPPRPGPRLAKVLAPGFARRSDDSWSTARERNTVAR